MSLRICSHIFLSVAPVCARQQQLQYGAGRKEEISISCRVESYPEPTSFKWAFNRSSQVVDIAQNSHSRDGWTSTLSYLPQTELDFGSLLCWAQNDVGSMKVPCVIQVVPAGKRIIVVNRMNECYYIYVWILL